MTGQCVLAADINHCQYYVRECSGCIAPHNECGMLAREVDRKPQKEYVRKPEAIVEPRMKLNKLCKDDNCCCDDDDDDYDDTYSKNRCVE